MVSLQSSSTTNDADPLAQLLRIRSPTGTSRLNVEPTTSGEEFGQMILATIPSSEAQPDPSTLKLSNQPGPNGESVPFDALKGRKVGDMGFRWVWGDPHSIVRYIRAHKPSRIKDADQSSVMGTSCSSPTSLFLPTPLHTLRQKRRATRHTLPSRIHRIPTLTPILLYQA